MNKGLRPIHVTSIFPVSSPVGMDDLMNKGLRHVRHLQEPDQLPAVGMDDLMNKGLRPFSFLGLGNGCSKSVGRNDLIKKGLRLTLIKIDPSCVICWKE